MSTYDTIITIFVLLSFPIGAYGLLCLFVPRCMPFGGKVSYDGKEDLQSFFIRKEKCYRKKRIYAGLVILYAAIHFIVFICSYSEGFQKKAEADAAREDSIKAEQNRIEQRDIRSERIVNNYMKENLNDPDSYEQVKMTYEDVKNGNRIIHLRFRAKNGFGAKMLSTWEFVLDSTCTNILYAHEEK